MESIGMPDTHFLSSALGWMELGNCAEAKHELAKVSPTLAEHPTVLEVTWAVHAAEKDWAAALAVADRLVASAPDHANGWLHRAYAIRRAPGGGLQAAWDALLGAVDRFPQEATIPYNLACYACQLSQLDEARRWLQRAMAVGDKAKLKSMAISDSDLEPLWGEIKSL
ncbi:MAG: tetratricopeptide repeat protein [Verrucomicrobiota bacterium]